MRKKFILIAACVLGLTVFAAGCDKQTAATDNNREQMPGNGMMNGTQNASGTPMMNFGEEKSISDLAVGKMVTVMGKTNTDGTIDATRIIFGEMPMMQNAATNTPKKFTKTTSDVSSSGGGSGGGQEGGGGMQGGPSGGGDFGGGMPPGMNDNEDSDDSDSSDTKQNTRSMGESRTVGEIMKINETDLILKVKDGGSMIVHYSSSTKVYEMSASSTPMMAPPSSTPNMAPPTTTNN